MKQARIIPLLEFQHGTLPIKVQTIHDFALEQDDTSEGPHTHNYFEMFWLLKGKGTLQVDMQEHIIESNSIFCVKPNQAHQFQTSADMEGFVFSFTDSFFKMDEYELGWASQGSLFQVFAEG